MPVALDEAFLRITAELARLVVLAFLIERGLALIFDHRWYRAYLDGRGFKAIIAFVVALGICLYYDFDVVAALLEPTAITNAGLTITALIVGGGSAAAVKLFQDVLGFSRDAREQLKEVRRLEAEAEKKEAEARQEEARARIAKARQEAAAGP